MSFAGSQGERDSEGWGEVLRREFGAEEGSFLIKMRCGITWDVEAFSRMTGAMAECCRAREGQEMRDLWEANGFWYLSNVVKEWTTHPDFPREQSAEYYERANRRLEDLAFWYFDGASPYMDGKGFEPM